jgi:hypothetical protein
VVGFWFLGNVAKVLVVDNIQPSKRRPWKIVGGMFIIFFGLVDGYDNLGRNPVSNVVTIIMMIFFIILGLGLTGDGLRVKKN